MSTPFEDWWVSTGQQVKTSLSFKWNLCDTSRIETADVVSRLVSYVRSVSSETDPMVVTAGQHQCGKNEVAHVHVSVACLGFKEVKGESRRRNTFTALQGELDISCKIKTIMSVESLECLLKYPWKEKMVVPVKTTALQASGIIRIPQEIKEYLLQSAHAMFQAAQAGEQKRERAGERNRSLLGELEAVIKGDTFTNYDDYVKTISRKFLEPLDVEDYPDFAILKKQIQKLAVKKRIVSFEKFFI